jgi:hypothetical protein
MADGPRDSNSDLATYCGHCSAVHTPRLSLGRWERTRVAHRPLQPSFRASRLSCRGLPPSRACVSSAAWLAKSLRPIPVCPPPPRVPTGTSGAILPSFESCPSETQRASPSLPGRRSARFPTPKGHCRSGPLSHCPSLHKFPPPLRMGPHHGVFWGRPALLGSASPSLGKVMRKGVSGKGIQDGVWGVGSGVRGAKEVKGAR